MRTSTYVIRMGSLIVAGLVIAVVGASSQSTMVVFQGLPHTGIGGAVLRLDRALDALNVTTFDPAGQDGVATALRDATSWASRLEASGDAALALDLSWHAIADSRRIASASMRRVGTMLELSARFTGATTPTYSASVYANGRLVGALGGLPPTAHVVVPESFCRVPEFAAILNCRLVSRFHNTPNGCGYGFLGRETVSFRLPNGTVVAGNELRLEEEVAVPGQYAYMTFNAMVMQSNADLTVLSENVR